MERKKNETYLEYSRRLLCALKDKTIDYKQFGDSLLDIDNVYSDETIRKFTYPFEKYLKRVDENTVVSEASLIKNLEDIKFETIKERKKLQRINQEYHANAREMGDNELYHEMWIDAIRNESPIKIVPTTYKDKSNIETTGFCILSDAHYGKEVKLNGLFNEVVNEYSPEIYKARMWKLLSDMENDFYDMGYDKLIIVDIGDIIEGILRCTKTLRKLKTGIIESANDYANFMAEWLVEVHNRLKIPVKYSLIGGNHDIIRILSSKKDFDDENIAEDVCNKIKDKIEINKLRTKLDYGIIPDIVINDYKDIIYHNLYGMNIMSYHGDTKNLKQDIEFFENYYQIDVDILICGHLHRSSQETIGYGYMGDREIIRVPSIIGVDEYAKSIKKLARAGVKFMTFDKNGKNWEKTYFLN